MPGPASTVVRLHSGLMVCRAGNIERQLVGVFESVRESELPPGNGRTSGHLT